MEPFWSSISMCARLFGVHPNLKCEMLQAMFLINMSHKGMCVCDEYANNMTFQHVYFLFTS